VPEPAEAAGTGLVSTPRAVVTPFISSVVLGVGVALLLEAALGSDGYSTLINGLSIATGVPFVVVNCVVGVLLVAMAWARGLRPGLGTLVQPVVVGFTVSAAMNVIHRPDHLALRGLLLLLAFPVLTVGVAGLPGQRDGRRPHRGRCARLGTTGPVQVELQRRPGRRCPCRLAARRRHRAGHGPGGPAPRTRGGPAIPTLHVLRNVAGAVGPAGGLAALRARLGPSRTRRGCAGSAPFAGHGLIGRRRLRRFSGGRSNGDDVGSPRRTVPIITGDDNKPAGPGLSEDLLSVAGDFIL